jgi:hypothetical protein
MQLPLYTFNYKGDPDLYMGVMAQDVLKVMPAAVSIGRDGYYRVNYNMIGVPLKRLGPDGQWQVVNTDTDQRYKQTERRLMQAMQKPATDPAR